MMKGLLPVDPANRERLCPHGSAQFRSVDLARGRGSNVRHPEVLQDIVQAAMGWMDYHYWEFVICRQSHGLPTDEDWGTAPTQPPAKVRLRDVLTRGRTVIACTQDSSDNWEHELIVTDVRAGQPSVGYPRFVAGDRNGPPEDCGGIPGFHELLEACSDPDHLGHGEVEAWVEGYDPAPFDELPKYAFGRIAACRNAAAAHLPN